MAQRRSADTAHTGVLTGRGPDGFDSTRRSLSRLDLVLIIVGVGVLGFVLGRLTAPDPAPQPPDATVLPPATVAFPSGNVDRTDHWRVAGFEPQVVDTFERPDRRPGLGATATGQEWQADRGTWRTTNGTAAVAPRSGTPSLAVVDAESDHALVEVTMAAVATGAGLVFRYQDPENYWAVTVHTERSWILTATIVGESETVGVLPAPATDGTTVSVNTNGDLLRILVEGDLWLEVDDHRLAGHNDAGLIALTNETGRARWDRFYAGRFTSCSPCN